MLESGDTRGVVTLCPGALARQQGGNTSFQCNEVNAKMEASVWGCGSPEVGRLASLRSKNALLEKSRGPGRMSGCQGGEKRQGIVRRGEDMGQVMTCVGVASEPESADVTSSTTISTSAEGSAQVQTNFEIATNLNINLED